MSACKYKVNGTNLGNKLRMHAIRIWRPKVCKNLTKVVCKHGQTVIIIQKNRNIKYIKWNKTVWKSLSVWNQNQLG